MINDKLKLFRDFLLEVTPNVFHYYSRANPEFEEFIVWQESPDNGELHADNRKVEMTFSYEVELYTKVEYSETLETLAQMLTDRAISWDYLAVSYEPDFDRYIHHSLRVQFHG